MNFRSYVGNVFVVESSKAIIRNEQLKELKYAAGDVIPPGKSVGNVKIIPQRTEIKVTDIKTDWGGTRLSSLYRPRMVRPSVGPPR